MAKKEVKIELSDGNVLTPPASWNQLTWERYDKFEKVKKLGLPPNHARGHAIAALCGVEPDVIGNLGIDDVRLIESYLAWITEPPERINCESFTHNGQTFSYKFQIFGQSVRVEQAQKAEDPIGALAALFLPLGSTDSFAEQMKQSREALQAQSVPTVLGLLFFLKTLTLPNYVRTPYFKRLLLIRVQSQLQTLRGYRKAMGWWDWLITSPNFFLAYLTLYMIYGRTKYSLLLATKRNSQSQKEKTRNSKNKKKNR